MPARRRRGYGGSYGRKRARNRRVVLGVLLVALGVAAAWYLRKDDAAAPARITTLPTCAPSAQPAPAPTRTTARVVLPPETAVTLSVLNGTNRSLLAKHVADALAAQGFHVTGQGNARSTMSGPSQVLYGPGAALQARTASLWVLGSTVVPAPKAARGSVHVVLGTAFTRLATPAEVAVARRGPAPLLTPAPSPSASVIPCRA
jgi:hypothetical protein